MGRLENVKAKLAALIAEVKMETIKTDKAVLEYDGELAEGTAVYVLPEGAEERVAAEDGEYVTEDNKVITVADGKVISIAEKEEETPEETPTEDVVAEEVVEETPEEVTEEPNEVEELKKRVEELEKIVEEIVAEMLDFKDEMSNKLNMSAAKPITEEFEQSATKKTGDVKVDRFIERYGKK